eukprot:UN25943
MTQEAPQPAALPTDTPPKPDISLLKENSKVELLWDSEDGNRTWSLGTIVECKGGELFRIKFADDDFSDSLTYNLSKHTWRMAADQGTAVAAAAEPEDPNSDLPEGVYEVEKVVDKRLDEDGTVLYFRQMERIFIKRKYMGTFGAFGFCKKLGRSF